MLTYYLDNVTVPGEPRLTRQLNFFAPQAVAGVVDDLTITYDLVDDSLNPVHPVDQTSLPVTINGKIFGANQIRKANLRVGGPVGSQVERAERLPAQYHQYRGEPAQPGVHRSVQVSSGAEARPASPDKDRKGPSCARRTNAASP